MAPGVRPHMTFRFHLKMRLFFAVSRFSFNLPILERAFNTQNKSEMSSECLVPGIRAETSPIPVVSWCPKSALRSCRVSWWRKLTALPTLSPFFFLKNWRILGKYCKNNTHNRISNPGNFLSAHASALVKCNGEGAEAADQWPAVKERSYF